MENMERILKEAFEVAFLLANQTSFFGPTKIVELIEQIIPTAYVYGTSYWVFYDYDGELICVCKKYGLNCKHKFQDDNHCLDITPILDDNDIYFYDRKYKGAVLPTYVTVNYKLINGNVKTTTSILLKHSFYKNGRHIILGNAYVKFNINFALALEIGNSERNFIFFPHPATHPYYGECVPDLVRNIYQKKIYKIMLSDELPSITIYAENEYFFEIHPIDDVEFKN